VTATAAGSARRGEGFVREAFRNRRLLGVALIAAIGGFLFGYDTGVIGGALLFMKTDLGLHTHAQVQLTVAILLLGAILGAESTVLKYTNLPFGVSGLCVARVKK